MKYNWQQSDWPEFRYDLAKIEGDLLAFADKAGQVSGILKSLPESTRLESVIDVMIAEAIKTSEIEGEYLSRQDVQSSIRKQLGLDVADESVRDPASQGAAELMVNVRNTWQAPLTEKTLFSWHKMLMNGPKNEVLVGGWRTHESPMQVVSGPIGRPKIHYEAPPSKNVPTEMARFFSWFNKSEKEILHAPVRAALAHLHFESIHPFEDGNGRIGRAISEKALSQGLNRPVLLSLSRTIEADRKAYYKALEIAQTSNVVTDWLGYFLKTALEAQTTVETQLDFVVRKTHFFDFHKDQLNKRQLRVVQRMLEEGPGGFEGGINARKYVAIAKASKATATRDLQDLVEAGTLVPIGKGRSRRYELNL